MGWALATLAYAVRGLGDVPLARQHLAEALRAAAETRYPGILFHALPAMALPLVDAGEVERGVELYAVASRHPYVGNSRWFETVAGKHIAAVATTLPPEVVKAAQERGRARDLWATASELLMEPGA